MSNALERLLGLWAEITDVATAERLLAWDQETHMPPKGQPGRAKVLGTLAGIKHAKLTSSELADALAEAAEQAASSPEDAAQVAQAEHVASRARRVPVELAKALAEASSAGLAAWQSARAARDFGLFEGALATLVRLRREQAEAIDPGGNPYEALMDDYEPGAREQDVARVFAELRAELAPLVQKVAQSGRQVDESPARGHFQAEAQLAFARGVARELGFDFEAGRLDRSAHPFCSGLNPGDVRLTWRCQEDDFRPAFFGILHETGHGLYEQGLPRPWWRTPIGAARSMSIHESQSRLWENVVGRSRGFWRWALPAFREHFPEKRGVTVAELFPALHTVAPSPIRVEADEATYNLHIVARFEIERRLLRGEVGVRDLPALWDDTYEELLGLRPSGVDTGVLQDIHWSMGAFGYFPTYALGNLINAQLFEAAERELGPQEEAFAEGQFAPLLGWMRARIHALGSRYSSDELVRRATGEPLSARAFLAHVRRLAGEVYGVAV